MYTSDRDRRRWLRQAKEHADEHGLVIGEWCLMQTHYHLVLLDPHGRLPDAMRDLNSGWARCCNARDGQRGTVLWSRYFDTPVQTESHRLAVARYVPLNPVAAGYCRRPEEYPWSSHRAIALEVDDPLCDREWVLRPFGGDAAAYVSWVGESVDASRFRPPSRLPAPVVEEVRPSLAVLLEDHEARVGAALAAAWGFRLREIAGALGVSTSTVGRWAADGKKCPTPFPV
jgi:REP element-mobilizing transposase RayT